jgi:hypothetical protein
MWRKTTALAIGALTLLWASSASAFCRSTTCRSTGGKECPTDGDGCPAEGAKLFWPTSCISYATNELGTQDLDPVDTRAIIKKTFQAWTDVPCPKGGVASMAFQEREPVSCKKSEYNKEGPNLNVVLFQDDDWKYRGIDGTLAKTSVTYNDETGEIYDADIEVNTANNTVTISDDPKKIQYDLQAILTHEVGHFIGIAHSSNSDAVMFASYSPGSIAQRKLTPDDVAAVCAIYKPNSGTICNVEPKGGFSPTCDPPEEASTCSVAAPHTNVSSPALPTSPGSLAFMGLGILAVTRIARRRTGVAVQGDALRRSR